MIEFYQQMQNHDSTDSNTADTLQAMIFYLAY
jgi:hypothetical protein